VQSWEQGPNYPGADRRRALIALYLRRGVFAPGRKYEEAVALWNAARVEAPRLHAPFDSAWFASLQASSPAAARPSTGARALAPAGRLAVVPLASREQDWGGAPDIGAFHGRAPELATLTRWMLADGGRLVAILGIGGIDKTALAAHLAREVAPLHLR
jgi:hypothetical protein